MQIKRAKVFFLVLSMFLAVMGGYGQGWEKAYGDSDSDGLFDLINTADGGLITVGHKQQTSYPNLYDLYILKTDADGEEDWSQSISKNSSSIFAKSILPTADGGYIIGGTLIGDDVSRGYILKTDALGNFEWDAISPQDSVTGIRAFEMDNGEFILTGNIEIYHPTMPGDLTDQDFYWMRVSANGQTILMEDWYGGDFFERSYGAAATDDNGIIMAGITNSFGMGHYDAYLIKLDSLGDTVWTRTHGSEFAELIFSISACADGNFILAGESEKLTPESEDVLLVKINPAGDTLWWVINEKPGLESATGVKATADGGYVITGGVRSNLSSDRNVFLLKTDADGQEQWKKDFGGINSDGGNEVLEVPNEGFAIAGFTHSYGAGSADGYLIRTDFSGISNSCYISGNVHTNFNNTCIPDNIDSNVENYIVEIAGTATYFGTTDADGNYLVPVSAGSYNVRLINPSPYWVLCEDSIDVSVTGTFDTASVNFSMYADTICSLMQVDLTTLGLRRCFENSYTVKYNNLGTAPADPATVDVTFDPYLLIDSASIPWTSQVGNTYTFDLGFVDVLEGGEFKVFFEVDCDSTVLGQTHCSEAHIYPDEFCLPPDPNWDGASIELNAECKGDSILFTINNIGSGDMNTPLEFIVIEDVIIGYQGEFLLDSGQDTTIVVPASGATLRMQADQSPGHPGNSKPCVSVEGCGDVNFSTGFIIQYPLNDADLFIDTDCRENTGSFDPNDKQGFPMGYGSQHFIEPNTDIEYLIRFQNTGTDTAFIVQIRDTLSSYLNAASVEPGASSHPYRFELYGNGVLKFTFDDIMLPDSNVNEPASHGFVKFRIRQNRNLEIGTVIENSAGIYFDYNEPIITNTTFHTIGLNFISVDPPIVDDVNEQNSLSSILVYPNPFMDKATFELENVNGNRFDFSLFDAAGRLVSTAEFRGNKFQFDRSGLPAGVYFFRIIESNDTIYTGKIVLQ